MTPERSATDWRTLALFAAASGAAIAFGSIGLAQHGAGAGTWLRNPAAWLAGVTLGGVLVLAGRSQRLSVATITVTILALAASLFAQDQSGVHRWLDVGPIHINVAALLLPITVVALSTFNMAPAALLAVIGVFGGILVAQPDASQATAFLLATALIVYRRTPSPALLTLGLLAMAGLTLAAWLRPSPLQPVPEVEGIFRLIAESSLPLAAAAALALALTCIVPLRTSGLGSGSMRDAAITLSVYFSAAALMPFLGAYPVPLLGVGMSFPLGFWLAMALLSARERQLS